MERQTVTIAEVAQALGLSESHVRRNWRKWVREQGFPAPLNLSARVQFHRGNFEAYLANQGASQGRRRTG